MHLVFTIDRDDLSDERLEEYKRLLNIMCGIDGEWVIERRTETAQKQPEPTETGMNKSGADGV